VTHPSPIESQLPAILATAISLVDGYEHARDRVLDHTRLARLCVRAGCPDLAPPRAALGEMVDASAGSDALDEAVSRAALLSLDTTLGDTARAKRERAELGALLAHVGDVHNADAIATALAEAGDITLALDWAARANSGFESIAFVCARKGDRKNGELGARAAEIACPDAWCVAMRAIAREEEGATAEARSGAREALSLLRVAAGKARSRELAHAQLAVVRALAAVGDFEMADALAPAITSTTFDAFEAQAWLSLGHAAANADKGDRAEDYLYRAIDALRLHPLDHLVSARARVERTLLPLWALIGETSRASSGVHAYRLSGVAHGLVEAIALALAAAGSIETALAVAARFEAPSERVAGLIGACAGALLGHPWRIGGREMP